MMNFILRKKGYPLVNVPYEGRNRYYTALERAQLKKIDSAFVLWFMRIYKKENDAYLPRSNLATKVESGRSIKRVHGVTRGDLSHTA